MYNYHDIYAVASIRHDTRIEQQFNTSQSVSLTQVLWIILILYFLYYTYEKVELHNNSSKVMNINNFKYHLWISFGNKNSYKICIIFIYLYKTIKITPRNPIKIFIKCIKWIHQKKPFLSSFNFFYIPR